MAEIDDVLAGTISTITGAIPSLHGYAYVVPAIQLPAVMAFPPDELDYADTFSDDATMLYTVRLYVQRTQDGSDQAQLNAYISRNGAQSVHAAVRANPTLGGIVADAMIKAAVNYGNFPVSQNTYLGVELRIQAMLR